MHNSSLCFTSSSYLRKGTPKNGSGPHSPGMRALFCLLSSFKFNSLESGGKARTGGHLILSGWRLFHQDLWMHHIRRPEPVRDGVSLSLSSLSSLSSPSLSPACEHWQVYFHRETSLLPARPNALGPNYFNTHVHQTKNPIHVSSQSSQVNDM